MKKVLLASAGLLIATPASAATFVVDAFDNSVSGGTGLSTISLTAGQIFTVTSSTDDLWSAGALPRFSDADGLVADRFASAMDDSGQAVGTQIGRDFGNFNAFGLSAAFGSLVGNINGTYQVIGANFSGAAWDTGTLELFYWDSNQRDNFGEISFDVNAVPEPATWAFMILGFGAIGGAMRRHKAKVTNVTYA
ncbi:PEP-CTERM protein-sorting domain-containing protein [Parasphingorhabdus marina DSM 22363]|uniref:PEP-CTERM protein-sorting domain-containing protein n=1 Tax=Parasphingorhabdus marina DSM 22363 TaxID=1123272 RepID=A0A1N6CML5_9SPHN|nr:PEPxxWA-CTERM sorting domain-containing protein [Parasphingorhabdus marina]SIN59848.1 PEP-CTERM protein-sorting domain-containing protein [Parasphingorhabdus marina DSM 22363]